MLNLTESKIGGQNKQNIHKLKNFYMPSWTETRTRVSVYCARPSIIEL